MLTSVLMSTCRRIALRLATSSCGLRCTPTQAPFTKTLVACRGRHAERLDAMWCSMRGTSCPQATPEDHEQAMAADRGHGYVRHPHWCSLYCLWLSLRSLTRCSSLCTAKPQQSCWVQLQGASHQPARPATLRSMHEGGSCSVLTRSMHSRQLPDALTSASVARDISSRVSVDHSNTKDRTGPEWQPTVM